MVDNSIEESFDNSNKHFEQDMDMQKLKEQLKNHFNDYRDIMRYMLADAPIGTLCLPRATEKLLLDQGFLRIYDLFDVNFVEIKGFGAVRCRQLTASLDEFFAML